MIGWDRLPDLSDKPQLPYISAVVKEVLRWGPPTPIGKVFSKGFCVNQAEVAPGGAHRVMEDDIYKGLLIPAGTVTIYNTWYETIACALSLPLVERSKGRSFVMNRCTLMPTPSILVASSGMVRSTPT